MSEDAKVVGRIAPSPSGLMHLGNAFSALLAWASARSQGGEFVLRLEDLDERCRKPEHARGVLEDLRWLGIDWDGDIVLQSVRLNVYEDALARLADVAELYPCFCTRADLHAASAPHASDGTPIYAGTCHGLGRQQQRELAKERGGRVALRLHVPDERIAFDDVVQGRYVQDLASECGDFVLRRSDGVFAYQLVCVVDDIASGVTEVARASDLLSSTPRQILLYRLLDAPVPRFAHHPLLLAPDGRRLSKRDEDATIASMRAQGQRPEAIVGSLAAIAGQCEAGEEMTACELAQGFDWSKVPRGDMPVNAGQ